MSGGAASERGGRVVLKLSGLWPGDDDDDDDVELTSSGHVLTRFIL